MLETNRLIIRRFQSCDMQDLFEYLSDKDVVSFEPYPPFTADNIDAEIKQRVNNPSFLAVCIKDTNKLIGNLYYNKVEPDKIDTYEIGYVFNKNFHGMGYATEAGKCLLDYIFTSLKAHRIIANCNTENSPSWRLMERLELRREAERIENMFFDTDDYGNPLWFNSYQYAILRREYVKGKE